MVDRFPGGFGVRPFPGFPAESAFPVRVPAVDITKDEAGFTLTAELPGLTERDLEVSLTDNMLLIRGEKRGEKEQKDKGYTLSERSYGAFRRSFVLPDGVDAEGIEAAVANGVLTVTDPKTAASAARRIEVKAAA